jgi:hypothetical protein
MAHDIRLVHVRDFLRRDVDGAIDVKSSKRLLKEVANGSVERDNHRIFIDIRDIPRGSKLSAVDILEIARILGELGFGPHNRIAILNDPKDDFDRGAFLETCAVNRSINIRAFRDFEKAHFWLAGDCAVPA